MAERDYTPFVYLGLGILAYLVVRELLDTTAKDDNAQLGGAGQGGLWGGLERFLTGTPQAPTTTPIAPVPATQTARGLFVRWIQPAPGGRADRAWWRRDYPAVLELENATGSTLTGLLEIQVDENGLTGNETVTTTAGPYTFEPGERRQVSLALRTNTLLSTLATATVRLGGRLAIPDQAQQFTIA